MAYSDKLMDHYDNPRNVGALDKADDSVGTGMVGAPACGDVMKLQIKVNEQGIIEDAKFKTYGCGSAIASSSLVTEWVKGKTVDQALEIKNSQIAEELVRAGRKVFLAVGPHDRPPIRRRERLRARLAERLPRCPDGSIQLMARAWTVRATVPRDA